jgi:cytochrome bd-type quinol oxidase subunit 2
MNINFKKITILLILSLFIIFPGVVLAQGIRGSFGEGSPLETVRDRAGFEEGDDVGTLTGRVINTALSLVGIIFLVLMVYAGYLWMTARGEEAQITKAKDIIRGTIIGLVLVLSAYAITIFVTRSLNRPVDEPAPEEISL